MAKLALLGCGTVGSGVIEILEKNHGIIAARAGGPLEIKKILRRKVVEGETAGLYTRDFADIISDPEITVVAECMGGLEPAFSYARATLESGRSFVTANKQLVAEKGDVLSAMARAHGVAFLFEAAVAGTVPVIKTLSGCFAGNNVDRICGILNGTTNYILTKMRREGCSFDEALAEAQALGYAEADPAADVEGTDACRKICILADLAFGSAFSPEKIHTEGITKITADDVAAAGALGGAVKLIASALRVSGGRAAIRVTPCYVPGDHPLCAVEDVLNGATLHGDSAGEITLTGAGAGKLPTGSAVVSDIIEAVVYKRSLPALFWGPAEKGALAPFAEYPVSALVYCENGAAATELFDAPEAAKAGDRSVLLTPPMTEALLADKMARLRAVCPGAGFLRTIPR